MGGTFGDFEVMPYAEALSHFSVNELKSKDFVNVHVSYLVEVIGVHEVEFVFCISILYSRSQRVNKKQSLLKEVSENYVDLALIQTW